MNTFGPFAIFLSVCRDCFGLLFDRPRLEAPKLECWGELRFGVLEAKAVRSKPSWSGVKVRSGPYAVPFMILQDVCFSEGWRSMRFDVWEKMVMDVGKVDGSWGHSLRNEDGRPRQKETAIDLKDAVRQLDKRSESI